MRQFLLLSMLLAATGCQCLPERKCRHECTTETVKKEPERCAPAPERGKPRETEVTPERAAALAQEVLLVPRTVYMPFVAASPTAPVRMSPNMTVMNDREGRGPAPTAPEREGKGPTPPGNEREGKGPTQTQKEDCTLQLLDMCRKMNYRLDCMEKCIKERKPAPPAASPDVCPPQPLFPLFRRPLFNRSEPLFNRCDPNCETMVPCEPVVVPSTSAHSPMPPPTVTTVEQAPRRTPMVNID